MRRFFLFFLSRCFLNLFMSQDFANFSFMCWLIIEYTTNGIEVRMIWSPQNRWAEIGFLKFQNQSKADNASGVRAGPRNILKRFLRDVETDVFASELNCITSKFLSFITKHRSFYLVSQASMSYFESISINSMICSIQYVPNNMVHIICVPYCRSHRVKPVPPI